MQPKRATTEFSWCDHCVWLLLVSLLELFLEFVALGALLLCVAPLLLVPGVAKFVLGTEGTGTLLVGCAFEFVVVLLLLIVSLMMIVGGVVLFPSSRRGLSGVLQIQK